MVDRTPRCPRRSRRLLAVRYRLPEFAAPALLLVAFLAWPAVRGVDAQTEAPRPDSPPPLPTPSVPGKPAPPPAQQVPVGPPAVPLSSSFVPDRPALHFKIDPQTPLKDLLPVPPKVRSTNGPVLSNDLARVPEIRFQARPTKDVPNTEAMREIAHQIAKINHLNGRKTDGFLEALIGERRDLAGLPFAMGDACRTKGERSRQFASAVATVRRALQPQPMPLPAVPPPAAATPVSASRTSLSSFDSSSTFAVSAVQRPLPAAPPVPTSPPAPLSSAEQFWETYPSLCAQQDKAIPQSEHEQREAVAAARVAALMQVLAPESPAMHLGLVKHLSSVAHVEATKALARLAIFATADDVRKEAIDALKVRRERDYTAILIDGLRYPWPAVARRAADAIVKLERTDLLPKLIEQMEQPDPRAPVTRQAGSKKMPVVRELVRVNHHRSCLLCHAPGNTGKVSPEAVSAAVPVPGEPLSPPSVGYRISSPDLIVRVDVTYLRQDFSALQPVADANPWPEMQRFDFLVRSRELNEEEAATYRDKLAAREPGEFSPYQRAALVALRELTGRDTEPTPQAWRRLLKLPARTETP